MRKLKHGWKPDRIDPRDLLYRKISKPRTEAIPESVDLREHDSPVMDQGDLGSCTGNSSAGAEQFMQIKEGLELIPVSRLMIYYDGREIEDNVSEDAGAEIRDVVKGLATQGVCSESEWPYDIDKFAEKPTEKCYEEAKARLITSYHRLITLNDMLECLADGFPFIFGFTVFSGFESEEVAKTGVVNMPERGEKNLGGHAVMAVGYDKVSQRFIIRNSWSADWGDKGYFTIPFEYLETLADDFWTIRK